MRNFPHPFKAGLAICSDIDDCDLDTFIQLHRFLNSSRYGLGLPVADSFFAVCQDSKHLAYLNPDGSFRPREAEFIGQAVRDGLVDSLHAWGDFNSAPPDPNFLQYVARKIIEDFTAKGLEIPAWINHGSPNNRQNLFARLCPLYQGDNPESEYYTVPIIKELGIKYFWNSEIVGWPLSTIRTRFFPEMFNRISRNAVKNCVKFLIGRSSYCRSSRDVTQLAQAVKLRDGNFLISFNRFSSGPDGQTIWEPSRHTLRFSLAESVLKNLVKEQGYLIIYTHLAKPAPRENDLFPPEDIKALRMLADYYHQGKIWVTPTSRLLDYWLASRFLQWKVRQENDFFIIDLGMLNHPIHGPRLPVFKDLAGLNFLTPEPLKTVVRLKGEDLPTKIFPVDETGLASVGFDVVVPDSQLVEV